MLKQRPLPLILFLKKGNPYNVIRFYFNFLQSFCQLCPEFYALQKGLLLLLKSDFILIAKNSQ